MKQTFTLIEMLVVITIIGILAALLTGPIVNALNSSYQTSCLNNLRQVGIGLRIYIDTNERFPTATKMISLNLNTFPSISEALRTEVPAETFKCPGDNKGYFEENETSYEWNMFLNNQSSSPKGWRNMTMKPADVRLMWDFEAFHGDEDSETGRNILYYDNTGNGL